MSDTDDTNVDITCTSAEPLFLECEESIPRISVALSYQEFFMTYLLRNRPCLFDEFVSNKWESRRTWSIDGKPNWQSIKETFGDAKVPVANCGTKEYNSQKKDTFTLCDYLDYLEPYISEGYPSTEPNLYLKDWHFTRDFPKAAMYRVPKYFASDWLNEYFSARTDLLDDYRFVYIGPKGSWTPLHVDVFTSYSWSINVVGRKRWLLFPPGQEVYLKDTFGNLAYDVLEKGTFDGKNLLLHGNVVKCFDITQETGEALFVPSGWHHQVWNLEDTISINHNWINGCNIRQVWIALQACLSAVQREVSDCRDMDNWESHCQLMLRATHGLDYEEFFDMLLCIAQPRIMQVMGQHKVKMYGDWEIGQKHAEWDLRQILATLNLMLSDTNFLNLDWVLNKKPQNLRNKIENVCEYLPEALLPLK